MSVIFGSARHDENGKYVNGKAGDQTGSEVSTQSFYMHSKGWYALRAKDVNLANRIAEGMKIACANNNIGYNQKERNGVVTYGIKTSHKVNSDCSALVRAVLKWAGVNVSNFTTANEKNVLMATGLFSCYTITNSSQCYTGDILVTKTSGHTGVIVSGNSRVSSHATSGTSNSSTASSGNLKKGSTGEGVKWLQRELNNRGYNLSVDGIFGSGTYNAVIDFQKKHGLSADGIVGPSTKKALSGNSTVSAKPKNPYAQPSGYVRKGSTGSGVKWVQWALAHAGYRISVDGIFGNGTYSAVRDFQSRRGLGADGIVGPATKKVLATI